MASTEERYSVNESLLQSYRSIFISSQSFLLAVGAIVSGKNAFILYVIAGLSLGMIWFVWFPVVRSRHLIVDYYKSSAVLSDADQLLLCSESEYVHDRNLRAKVNELFGIQTNWRETRVKIDLVIPAFFSAIWIALIIYEICAA